MPRTSIELVKSARPNDAPPRLVLNQVGMPKRPEIPAKDFAETMGLDPAAVIAFEPALFGQAANNGQMVIEAAPKAPVSEALRRLCRNSHRPHHARSGNKNAVSIFSFLEGQKGQLSHVRQAHRHRACPRESRAAAREPAAAPPRSARGKPPRTGCRARASPPHPRRRPLRSLRPSRRAGSWPTTARKTITRSSPPSLTP